MNNEKVEDHIRLGEFPYPLTDGPNESRYLTWLRNHSNYMAVKGFLDYVRSAGVLLRGIIINFLIFLPYLLIIAIVLAYSHHWMLKHPFLLTLWAVVLGLVWVLLFPIVMPLFQIFSYRRSLASGSQSTIKQRDLYERSFSALLLVILAIAVLESLPWMLEFLHDQLQAEKLSWQGGLATIAAALALITGSDKLLSVLSGVKKQLAMVLVGIVGLLVPLLVILYATHFLLYSAPVTPLVMLSPVILAVCYVIAIMIAIPLGLWRKTFNRKESAATFGLLVGALLLVFGVAFGAFSRWESTHPYESALDRIIAPMQEVSSYFERLTGKQAMTPEVAAFVEEVVKAHRESRRLRAEFRRQTAGECFSKDMEQSYSVWDWLDHYWKRLKCEQKVAQWERIRYEAAVRFFDLGDKLSTIPSTSLDPIRGEISKQARAELWRLLKEKEEKGECGYYAECEKGEGQLEARLRRSVLFRNFKAPAAPTDTTSETCSRKPADYTVEDASVCKGFPDPSTVAAKVCEKFRTLYTEKCKAMAIDEAIREARKVLETLPNEELAELISEPELYAVVFQKFTASANSGHAVLTRLAGKEALARQLTKDEMLCSIFYKELVCPMVAGTGDSASQENATKRPRGDFDRVAKSRFLVSVLERTDTKDSQDPKLAQRKPVTLEKLNELALLATSRKPNPPDAFWAEPDKKWETMNTGSELDPEFLSRMAGEALLRNLLTDLGVKRLEKILDCLNWDWKELNYDLGKESQHKKAVYPSTKSNPESKQCREINADDRKSLAGTSLDYLVGDVYESKSRLQLPRDLATPTTPNPAEEEASIERDAAQILEVARKAYVSPGRLREQVQQELIRAALEYDGRYLSEHGTNPKDALDYLARFDLQLITISGEPRYLELRPYAHELTSAQLSSIAVRRILTGETQFGTSAVDKLISSVVLGRHGGLERPDQALRKLLADETIRTKAIFVFLLAVVIWLGCWLTVDVNLTSIHGLYRDRLASAFLIGPDAKGGVEIERDIDLANICRYGARSIAPYHLINVALNLQGSKDIGLRDRNSDFFIFSKHFTGGHRTGYCRTEVMAQVFPQVSLGTAMAISAAAASPNMGRGTSRLAVAFMTMLNIRLGYWVPHPGLLEEMLNKTFWQRWAKDSRSPTTPPGFTFEEVFTQELHEIERRWGQVYPDDLARRHISEEAKESKRRTARILPSVEHSLVGIGFSGGGIRSAAINLGIAQELHKCGAFDHLDYMSTVSGGGYLGASISTLMRTREVLVSEIAGQVRSETAKHFSDISGTVTVTRETAKPGDPGTEMDLEAKDDQNIEVQVVVVKGSQGEKTYRFSGTARLAVENGKPVKKGDPLLRYLDVVIQPPRNAKAKERRYQFAGDAILNVRDKENIAAGRPLLRPIGTRSLSEIAGSVKVDSTETEQIVSVQDRDEQREYRFSRFDSIVVKTGDTIKAGHDLIQLHNTVGERFRWRVRPWAFLREMLSKLDETHRWVNLSDGGHIENLATIELLRRRCKYIIIGDGEADPSLHFAGLATLMRCAYIDLGIKIEIDLDPIRLRKAGNVDDASDVSGEHWAIGKITYPDRDKHGNHEEGYLLYLKSSFTGDEDEAIQEYRHRNPTFPHQTTADQFFDEGQFEAYRALGQHIAELALTFDEDDLAKVPDMKSFEAFEKWFATLYKKKGPKRLEV